MIPIDLSGKAAVITGGGQGPGFATAHIPHETGARVAITGFEDGEGKNRSAAESPGKRTKAGVVGMTKVLSKELGHRQITVNAVAPGVILAEMGKSIPEAAREEMLKPIPLGRFGDPEEVANTILFLCIPLAGYVTRQTIHVNGGWFGG